MSIRLCSYIKSTSYMEIMEAHILPWLTYQNKGVQSNLIFYAIISIAVCHHKRKETSRVADYNGKNRQSDSIRWEIMKYQDTKWWMLKLLTLKRNNW